MACAAFVTAIAAAPLASRSSFVCAVPTRAPLAAAPRRSTTQRHTLRCAIQRPERYSSQDWIRSLLSMPRSYVLYRIRSHILFNVIAASTVVLIHQYFPESTIWNVSPMPHQLLGTVMGLLLVFRTNAAYDRFWEARKLWGALVNRTRSMSISAMSYFGTKANEDPDAAADIIRLTIAFTNGLAIHLRGKKVEDELNEYLPEEALEPLRRAANPPLFISQLISLRIAKAFEYRRARGGNTVAERNTLERAVADLCDIQGACERIVLTPVPLSYSRHTSRFLSLWCMTLPILLVEKEGWFMVPGMAFLSWALFSIEEIGHLIEDPFVNQVGLPIERYATTITNNLNELLGLMSLHKSDKAPIAITSSPDMSIVEKQ